ncbi:fatty acid hydroxylase domain-containing protein 2-like [Saccostrea echinata]|uniref:fatty acid hydroxylase domain-containing protein 2-like n=1 Tax=Saccostrea echinata TaxID=191078 RepID=UPI002A80EE02|nr:fatty acid hydroxylase domain-containing protein 2-like [Saccostrea echinata]
MHSVDSPISPADPHDRSRVTKIIESIKKAIFILGTACIVFYAASNSITWHLQRIWGASGNLWQKIWDRICLSFGENDLFIGVVGTYIVTMSVFWLANFFLLIMEVTKWPKCLIKYKIQEDPLPEKQKPMLKRAIQVVLFNQTVITIPFMFGMYYLMKWRGCVFQGELPTFHWFLLELTVFSLVEELFFYYSHRLLHHRNLYSYIHKRHHEWTAPIGIISLYAHPIEHLVSNLLPPVLGPFLMGSHVCSAWLWFSIALLSTTVAHCGYHFPLLPSPEAHDYHHKTFINNFGVLGILDRLHGTDTSFRASKAYQRHILLLGLTPLSQQIPDSPSKKAQ